RFRNWLDLGYAGQMQYLHRGAEKRDDLNRVLPGVKSVICLRMNYLTEPRDLQFLLRPDEADVSVYALKEDYHELIGNRLTVLEQKIREEFPACQARAYVDTGPVLEKALAQRAGLGWIGKHTNLLTEGVGSWYFLAEILTDVDLPPSPPAVDRCGTCRACIDICPTRAIVAPYVLDARRCISYLTIELKEKIPLEFRKALGNRVFGCDDCQIVCPWNSFAEKAEVPGFERPPDSFQLMDLIGLDEEGFRARFRNTPVWRPRRRGFLRNVAVALGNSGDGRAVGPLTKVLGDPEPLIRAHAVWALGELLGEKVLPLLQEKLAAETDAGVLEERAALERKFGVNKPVDPSASTGL
ncbi:MAG: tRNA epoxyqueuosine(34) reductase QueG, partial [Nitrospinae bacterium CG11_big_fil_rev_8_21_14_0_20_56_8]